MFFKKPKPRSVAAVHHNAIELLMPGYEFDDFDSAVLATYDKDLDTLIGDDPEEAFRVIKTKAIEVFIGLAIDNDSNGFAAIIARSHLEVYCCPEPLSFRSQVQLIVDRTYEGSAQRHTFFVGPT